MKYEINFDKSMAAESQIIANVNLTRCQKRR